MSDYDRLVACAAAVLLLAVAGCGGGGSPELVVQGAGGSGANGSAGSSGDLGTGGSGIVITDDGGAGRADDSSSPWSADAGPICGNGVVEPPEQCDDGNTKPGDGCDGTCRLEKDWVCATPGQPCVYVPPTAVCGNGIIEQGEQCDLGPGPDSGTLNDGQHGCAADCTLVAGWSCPADGGACTRDAYCGDGKVETFLGEQCDDGTNDGQHGCSPTCQVVVGWKCPPAGGACAPDQYCGNGVVDPGEQCDDHNRRSYDGCSATCFLEPGWSCPPQGGACTRVCGNGVLDSGEQCDDGNIYSGDGCSSTCQLETDYSCPTPGQPCVYTPPPPPPQCGNDKIEGAEQCDDGNTKGGDGCSSTCQLEPGWSCPTPGAPCVAARCGDGILVGTEQCDDGNTVSGDGCSSTCRIEPNAICPPTGGACVPMVCGDGRVTGTEQCDDGNTKSGDGCSATCQIETGWICPLAGTPCVTVCGDGIVAGEEQCDEKGAVPCCTAACKLQPGWVCDPAKNPHSQPASAYCGNGIVDGPNSTVRGPEQCDDGNNLPFDGCSPDCKNEPLCGTKNTYLSNPPTVAYQCFAHCGDGLVLPPEQCDDGNTQDGDGCDHNCNIEVNPATGAPAWTCTQPAPGSSIVLPVIWRDFSPRSHPQFSIDPLANRRLPGIAQNNLQQVSIPGPRLYKYVPAYNTSFASPNFGGGYNNVPNWTMNGPGWVSGSEGYKQPPWMGTGSAYYAVDLVWWADQPATLTTGNGNPLLTPAGRYAQWYQDDATVNRTYAGTITLKSIAGGAFQYSCDDNGCDSNFPTPPTGFFPLDGKGWVAAGQETARDGGHNYSFTTETRYWFIYAGGERLDFYGDDDLWVFVNGQLALDIGGIHSKLAGYFQLANDGTATSCVENTPNQGAQNNCSTVSLGLQIGKAYEIAVFNAEREVVASNFQLTLRGFNSAPSACTPICGDGYVAGSEQCDRGSANVSPAGNTYGKCTTQCKLGPYCGDAVKNGTEQCDNGINIDAYVPQAPSAAQCAPGCVTPQYCGDGTVQKTFGEECDDGASNQNTYGHCQTNCRLGPRCGDGTIQASQGEQCDDGPNNGAPSSACDATCHKKCGNGVVDSGEQCDDGVNNGTPSSTCDTKCRFKCGNGVLDPGEACDDGKNDGSYGTCNANCTLAPYCGDSVVQNPPEACDNGASNSAAAYGTGSCTDQCLPGRFCGDGIVNGPEKCDDGRNTGQPGSCKTDCSAYVPTAQCGDGIVQPPEQCDDGKAVNGTPASKCDTFCRFKCGNGVLDPGEACDNGVNDGSYGTCNHDCTIAGWCGDGIKNGPEQCDNGGNNKPLSTAYGAGVCTTSCTFAPFCGDGRVQTQFGEECEGNVNCSLCKFTGPR